MTPFIVFFFLPRASIPMDSGHLGIPQDLGLGHLGQLSGIAVDFVSKLLFVGDQLNGQIYAMTLDGRYKTTIVTGVKKLGKIAVNPNLG